MAQSSVAIRYAKALLDLANEKGSLDQVFADMNLLKSALNNSSELSSLIKNPILGQSKKKDIFKALFKDKVSELSYGFFNLVIGKRREADVNQIADSFIDFYHKSKEITNVLVTTAVELDADTEQKIIEKIKSTASLKEVKLEKKVDPSIIGGYVVEFNNRILDNSVQSNLNSLKRRLSQN